MADRFSSLRSQLGGSDGLQASDNAHRAQQGAWLRPLLKISGSNDMTHINAWLTESEWRDPVRLRVT